MATPDNIFPIISQPGIQRDGTLLDSDNYIGGQWCRFYRGKPQKMGGYNMMFNWPTNVPRGAFAVPATPLAHVYVGDFQSLKYFPVDKNTGIAVGGAIDRTPDPFVSNPYNQWMFDLMFDTTSNESIIIAMANQNLYSIDQTTESSIFYGKKDSNDRLVPTPFSTSGGFIVLNPYLLIYGNDGGVSWTNANDPTTQLAEVRITGNKIVASRRTRGGTNSPSCLLWSLDSLIRVTNASGPDGVDFAFDTISDGCSILSTQSVIEYNSIIYWIGTDCFYMYNGVVQEWPNSMSLEYFFDNLNFAQRQKVWMTKYKRYGEIWIHYPSIVDGVPSQECDKLLIYNVNLQCWYDSNSARGCGFYNQLFGKPVLFDNIPTGGNYRAWRHEVGTDQVVNEVHSPIDSKFETSIISFPSNGPGGQNLAKDKTLFIFRLEPDFVQTGDMTLTINGRSFANSDDVQSQDPYVFNNDPTKPHYQEKIDIREKRRLMSFIFESNTIGGNYKMGKCLFIPREGDTRP